MTDVVVSKCCSAEIRFEPLASVPPPPGALLGIGGPPPGEWKGWTWVCSGCGTQCGVTYDYGTLDLGLVRDEDLGKQGDFEVLG